MSKIKKIYSLLFLLTVPVVQFLIAQDTSKPIHPGEPGKTPFWNQFSNRFIYAPVFRFAEVPGAVLYKYTVTCSDKSSHTFTGFKPCTPLSSIWPSIPEGLTTVTVTGLDKNQKICGDSAIRVFYKSPGFFSSSENPVSGYYESGKKGIKAIFEKSSVKYWLKSNKPDPSYNLYCYPNKVIGGVLRAMVTYSNFAETKSDRDHALIIAKRAADYLLSIRSAKSARYRHIPPTYLTNVDDPTPEAIRGDKKRWLMVPSAIDAALGFLDLYDKLYDSKYLEAARSIAQTLSVTQEKDGTWPLMVNIETGQEVHAQRLIPTSIIFFLDRLYNQYNITAYYQTRKAAWQWILDNPLKTYEWNAQFEDIHPLRSYENLAREQACEVSVLLFEGAAENPGWMAKAEELLRFAEDQFIFWQRVKDPDGLRLAIHHTKREPEKWITPCVLEQYKVYEPVARSQGIMINTYIKAHQITKAPIYLKKAKEIANTLVYAREWVEKTYQGTGEFPTWVWRKRPSNWLNNSYYAAQSLLNISEYDDNEYNGAPR